MKLFFGQGDRLSLDLSPDETILREMCSAVWMVGIFDFVACDLSKFSEVATRGFYTFGERRPTDLVLRHEGKKGT